VYDVLGKPTSRPRMATPEDKRKYTKAVAAAPATAKKPERPAKPSQLYANQREHDETPEQYGERLRVAIAEDPERYYQRGTIVRLEADEQAAAWDLWLLGKAIRDSELNDWWPRNPGSCYQYGRWCSYFPVCTSEASLDDPALFEHLEHTHPELSKEIQQCRA